MWLKNFLLQPYSLKTSKWEKKDPEKLKGP